MSKTTTTAQDATTEAAPTARQVVTLIDRLRAIVAAPPDAPPTMADIADARSELDAQLRSIQADIRALEDALVLGDSDADRQHLIALRNEAAIVQRRLEALAQPAEQARLRGLIADFERKCADAAKADEIRKSARRDMEAAQVALREATARYNDAAARHQTAVTGVTIGAVAALSPADRLATARGFAEIKHRYGLMDAAEFAHTLSTLNKE